VAKRSLIIYADGACLGNPGRGGAAAVLASEKRVVEMGRAADQTTNNEMELTALLLALQVVSRGEFSGEYDIIEVFLDSQYVLNGIKHWVHGWKKNGWKTREGEDVKHRLLWEKAHELANQVESKTLVLWNHVPGHVGVHGNERCDVIANAMAEGKAVILYDGPREKYTLDLAVTKETIAALAKIDPYYLSYINGTLYRDKTWPECEARVRGARSAKYKKITSVFEEMAVLKKWRVPEH
jgi:ribonuclease HI